MAALSKLADFSFWRSSRRAWDESFGGETRGNRVETVAMGSGFGATGVAVVGSERFGSEKRTGGRLDGVSCRLRFLGVLVGCRGFMVGPFSFRSGDTLVWRIPTVRTLGVKIYIDSVDRDDSLKLVDWGGFSGWECRLKRSDSIGAIEGPMGGC